MQTFNVTESLEMVNREYEFFPISNINIGRSGFIYMSGSLVEGFGNGMSDIDLYIVYDGVSENDILNQLPHDGVEMGSKSNGVIKYHFEHKGKRFDCECWNLEQIKEIISELNNIKLTNDSGKHRIPNENLDFLHRLKHGQAITFGNYPENFKKVKESLNFLYLNLYLVIQMIYLQDRIVEDVQGALLAQDTGTAYFCAKSLIDYGIHAYVAYFGETNLRNKWVYRKLKRYCETHNKMEILERYLSLHSEQFNEQTIKDFAERAISFTKELNSIVYYKMSDFVKYFPRNQMLLPV